ncbi:MAG: electron transfer flavoprotein subunit beta/FixA family protein [Microbacteriaceae bacterium]|jgi:electron transfer flavoprotein beta subunit|nr:electron transfer flavoprotein subunit beta/FixA family protein [Microbacteriaceae bacterium]HOA86786.1 electron transfer flavoprotein subunit beta/FixA family protein [Microbacteriaceae bacterium]HPZ33609.1 electron transfer flavoprotein subunit beta/FixA family protein [Microbacteriaceae bacterium]HQC92267.1 electron transfer flavoprotein subunit beta/FixA family protein [Microbacteriaceae bacterium]
MKIIVLVKEVPDTYGDRELSLESGLSNRSGEVVLDEISERAVEAAVTYAEANAGTEVVAIAMGPDTVPTALRKALAMGAAKAVHVLDDGLVGADLGLTAEVLAAAVRREGFDLVMTGNISTDGSGGSLPSMLGELLAVPAATNLASFQVDGGNVTGHRTLDQGSYEVSAALPAVISVTERMPDPRFPNFKGIMAAKKKPFETVTLADLGIAADDDSVSRSIVISVAERPARAAGVKIVDEGNAGEQLADFLIAQKLA